MQVDLTYVGTRAMVVYDLPLNEVVFDFYDRLKSITKGYASFDYHARPIIARATSSRCRSWSMPSRSMRCRCSSTATRAEMRGRAMVREAEGTDPAAHVPDPDSGGDRRQDHRARNDPRVAQGRDGEMLRRRHHRKRKLLEKQKEGKKRMRQFGKVKSRRRRSSRR